MEFKSTKGIFLQIADSLCNQILEGKLKAGDRVPSVRDLAAEMEVNRNTVMRTYSHLQECEIFENKRGIGFFISNKAMDVIKTQEKESFFAEVLPELIDKIKLLNLTSEDLKELITTIKANDHENK
ncbi:GntR family transcriptional regulator [Prolixibacteraceae bacterium JC049]|nr:GntR family transcriptional regulator [Prolixibacteraceae bacterium JC049]